MNERRASPPALLPGLLESTVEAGIEARFEVDGHSMLPLIRPGDVVRVRRLGPAGPRLGDVVAVRAAPGAGLLVHRVVGRHGRTVVLRGDNSLRADGSYAEREIIGAVSAVERRGTDVWFGAGRWGRLVALVVRTGLVRRAIEVVGPGYRRLLRSM